MTNLSPQTQAVLDAHSTYHHYQDLHLSIAAALRALVGQVFPVKYVIIDNCQYEVPIPEREQILAIANELEAL